jgi:HEPN domain-containing protein
MNEAVQRWLKVADADLAAAEHNLATGFTHHWVTAFHAQQAVEKYLKAYLVSRGDAEFPFTHNIRQLRLRLAEHDAPLGESLAAADPLTPYATLSRYPEREVGQGPGSSQVTEEAARLSAHVARDVATRISEQLEPFTR